MLDYPTYRIMHREAGVFREYYSKDIPRDDYDPFPEQIGNDGTLTDEEKMLCPPNIHGYLMNEKLWGEYLSSYF